MSAQEPTKKIAWFVVYVIWMILDAEVFWERSHLICILVGAIGTCALAFAEFDKRPALIISACTIPISIGFYCWIGPIVPPPQVGWLQPADRPTPPNGCTDEPDAGNVRSAPLIIVGSFAFAPGVLQGYKAITIGECSTVTLDIGPNGLSVSADIYSPDGTSLGVIRNNRYEIASTEGLIVERSGDLSTLVVHGADNQELLWVRFLNPKAIRIRGIFTCPLPRLQTIAATDGSLTGPGPRPNIFHKGCLVGGDVGLVVR